MNAAVLDDQGHVYFSIAGIRIAKGTFVAPATKAGSGWLTITAVGRDLALEFVRDFKKNTSLAGYHDWLDTDEEKAIRWLVPNPEKMKKMFPAHEIGEAL